MSLIREIVMFLCGLTLCGAQMALPGPCPKVQVVQNFDAPKYLGRWYEAEKYFFIFELGGKCITADYSDMGNNTIGVLNKNFNTFTESESAIQGEATLVSPPQARLAVRFPTTGNFAAPYNVVDTDYTSYALVWSCNDFGIFHLATSWILTREQNPPKSVLQKAYDAVDKNKIPRKYFTKTDQKGCSKNN